MVPIPRIKVSYRQNTDVLRLVYVLCDLFGVDLAGSADHLHKDLCSKVDLFVR